MNSLGLRVLSVVLGVCVTLQAVPLVAQDFRVFTDVRDFSSDKETRGKRVAGSLTLFHAGKIYDYLDALREVTIHEPAHRRFTIIHEGHQLSTEISYDEIRRYLTLAEDEAKKLIRDHAPSKTTALLQFQLQPDFQVSFDASSKHLRLTGTDLRYDVQVDNAPSEEIVETYLRSADWTAQLNSILHPQALLPAARLQLNDELRQRNVLPVLVQLSMNLDQPRKLRATHEWTWKLQPQDRQYIDHWESLLRDGKIKSLEFRQFQQQVLNAETARAK